MKAVLIFSALALVLAAVPTFALENEHPVISVTLNEVTAETGTLANRPHPIIVTLTQKEGAPSYTGIVIQFGSSPSQFFPIDRAHRFGGGTTVFAGTQVNTESPSGPSASLVFITWNSVMGNLQLRMQEVNSQGNDVGAIEGHGRTHGEGSGTTSLVPYR